MSSDPIYRVYPERLATIMARRGEDAKSLSKSSGVHYRSIERLMGEYRPPNMRADRLDMGRLFILKKLAHFLGTRPEAFSDAPPPKAKPQPDEPPHYPNDRRTKATKEIHNQRLDEVERAEHLEEAV
jgi:hypothetical protein